MNQGDFICFRHVRVYPQKQALADARVDWVDYSTKGSDQEFVALYLGAKAKDEPLELDQGLDALKKLGFVDVDVVYDVLIEDYDEEVVDDIMKRLGFERSV